ncbi:ArgE/DapE family deacylase [Ornithinibacillus halotolerans]|uniref:Probable succinyl-diaminopimelate desuccinylase n=1 Tax=Ornithinibacillus halotolerans TaxID=1274357 RepID=A0A916RN62_9BACI|nr:ArgE/DapE family deacylase [Ornithinibacillus halotolerans]GGA60413.1 succinyl-diaminopimelate desuccinylase [Ornithinibacillus halotolerans]
MKQFTEEEKIKILSDLIAIKSVNENEIEVANYLKDLFAQYGIESTIVPVTDTRVNLVAEIGSGKPVIGISGHMDVVSAGDETEWTSDPFTLTERDGKLYGRGTNDMKAGLVNLALVMIELKENNTLANGTVRFMATTGEEVGGAGSKKLYDEGYMEDVEYLWVAEPSHDTIIYSHKGSLNLRITSIGEAAHSSMPDQGYNAINPLMKYLLEMDEKLNGDERKNEVLDKLVMSTTIFNAGNQVNSIPEKAVAEINVRTIPEFDNEEVIALFNTIADTYNQNGANIKVEVTMSLPSVFTSGQSNMVELAKELGKKHLGLDIAVKGSPGVTDASNLLRDKDETFPFMMFGPGETKMAHKTDEYVYKDYYFAFFDIYKELIISLTK